MANETIVTAAQMRSLDQHTIQVVGIPSLVLMERAALAVRDTILNDFSRAQQIVVVAGQGNNGGDGLAVARMLAVANRDVTVITVGDPRHASADRQRQAQIDSYYQIPTVTDWASPLAQADLIVDAIFGIGVDRAITGDYARLINAINAAPAPVVAVDLPSGINTDTGEVMGTAVEADQTVTVAFKKQGLTTATGREYAGQITVADDMGIYEL